MVTSSKNLFLQSSLYRLLMLRTFAIGLQLVIILVSHFIFDFDLALPALLLVIALESIFQLFSVLILRWRLQRHKSVHPYTIVFQLLADIFFLTLLLLFSGGATNGFVSLLLLPIMIAAVTVSARACAVVTITAIAVYTVLMFFVLGGKHDHGHHMQMNQHFIAMWVNFVLSALITATLVNALSRTLEKQTRAVAQSREDQLRAEQLTALGSAAAMATHQLATPISSLSLMFEELEEQSKGSKVQDLVAQFALPIEQCEQQLALFRNRAEQLRAVQQGVEHQGVTTLNDLLDELLKAFNLQYPDHQIEFCGRAKLLNEQLKHDPLLVPALLNLLENCAHANQAKQSNEITLSVEDEGTHIGLRIEDKGHGFTEKVLAQLGQQAIESEQGLGVALWLSNATIDRIGGSLTLTNTEQGACIDVYLPRPKS